VNIQTTKEEGKDVVVVVVVIVVIIDNGQKVFTLKGLLGQPITEVST
jgi:hypothetical protein